MDGCDVPAGALCRAGQKGEKTVKLAIAQILTQACDFERTAARMAAYSRRAASEGADLLVFSAMALCGAEVVGPSEREGLMLDLADCLLSLAADLACPCVVPVLTDLGGVPAHEAMLIADGQITPLRLHAMLEAMAARAAEAEDSVGDGDAASRALPPAPAEPALPEQEFCGLKLGVAFSYEDLDAYSGYDYDVDLLLYFGTYGFATDDAASAMGQSVAESRFARDAATCGAWLCGVGSLGCYDSQVFCGSSFVLDAAGGLVAQAPSFEEAFVCAEVGGAGVPDPAGGAPFSPGPLCLTPEVYDVTLTAWGALTEGVRGVCQQAGLSAACVVVDGSLESMLTATLAVDALGPTRVHAVVQKTGHAATDKASEQLVRNLRLPAPNVDAPPLAKGLDAEEASDAARLRLARTARLARALPLGSACKTALALRPAAGVEAARLYPLGDVYASDVLALARLRNTISPVVPAGVACRALDPALGEKIGRFASLAAQLEAVDLVLAEYIEGEAPLSDIAADPSRAEVAQAVLARFARVWSTGAAACPRVIEASTKPLCDAVPTAGMAWADRVRPEGERFTQAVASALAKGGAQALEEAARGAAEQDTASGVPSASAQVPGREAAGAYRREQERRVRDMLGNLRDFSLGGGFSEARPGGDETVGGLFAGLAGEPLDGGGAPDAAGSPRLWYGPFSEN